MQKELPNSSIRIDNEAFGWRCLTVLVLIVLTPRAETLRECLCKSGPVDFP